MFKEKNLSTMAIYKNDNKFDKSNVRINKKIIIYKKINLIKKRIILIMA